MPQIAQQDYLYFKQSILIDVNIDCELYAFLVEGIEQGTIWDMIVSQHDGSKVGRVTTVSSADGSIYVAGWTLEYWDDAQSSANYSGLAAIQRALLAQGVKVDYVPHITSGTGQALMNDESGKFLSVNGKRIKATFGPDNVILTAIAISDEDAPEGSLEITEEDAQKLIGICTI